MRRVSEFFLAGMVVVPLLALPNLLGLKQLYPWWTHGHESSVAHAQQHEERHEASPPRVPHGKASPVEQVGEHAAAHTPQHAEHEQIVSKKVAYLNSGFFFIRAIIYMLIWLWITERFFRYSTAQDRTGDPRWTVKLQRFAPGARRASIS